MSELERDLTALAAEIEWPPTPTFELRFEPRPARRTPILALALAALALVALALAFAVPQSRAAILRFFHLGGIAVERVTTLPAAEQRPLAAGLGAPVSRVEAEAVLGGAVVLPPTRGEPQLYERDTVISALLATPEPVLWSALRTGDGTLLKKVAGISSSVEPVHVDDTAEGLWIAGEEHVVYWLAAPPRLAGNVLVWERDGVTYRLEGKALTKERAMELARAVGG